MPIKVKVPYEPFTPVAWQSKDDPPPWPTCEALDSLEREIERYCKGEIRGRSFLIAGHRGAGKTTLAHIAIERIKRRCGTIGIKYFPLFVPLLGPDFLTDHGPAEDQIRAALAEVVKATLRSASELISSCAVEGARNATPEVQETVAQLRVELDQAPELSTLREYWEHLGALKDGFLHRQRGSDNLSKSPDQGLKELVALHTCIDAYRVLAESKSTKDVVPRDSVSIEANAILHSKWKNIEPILRGLTPFVSIAAGIIVASTLREFFHPVMLVALGLATTLICTIFLRSTALDRNERTLFAEGSPAALDRLLPVLVGRLCQAGMAPIFVVDELDKVKGLDHKMETLLTHLKHFIADRAFFCFLADRAYLESVVSSINREPYPVQSTLFSSRFLVHYTPKALRNYLDTILESDPADESIKELVIYVLLLLSRLHIGDLHRILGEHTDRQGCIRLPESAEAFTRAYQYMALMQLAVEEVLQRAVVARRLRQKPYLRQIVYDALYYPARKWRLADREDNNRLDCGREAFIGYLGSRTTSDLPLTAEDKESLYRAMLIVVDWLAQPSELIKQLPKELRLKSDQLRDKLSALEALVGGREEDKAIWQYDDSGQALAEGEKEGGPGPPPTMKILRDRIDCVDAFLRKVSSDTISGSSLYELGITTGKPVTKENAALGALNEDDIRRVAGDYELNADRLRVVLLLCFDRWLYQEDPSQTFSATSEYIKVNQARLRNDAQGLCEDLRKHAVGKLDESGADLLGQALGFRPKEQYDSWLAIFSKLLSV